MVTIQSPPGVNKDLILYFLLPRSPNHLRFIGKCVVFTEKRIPVKKTFENRLNRFVTTRLNWKKSQWSGKTIAPCKETVTSVVGSKEGHTDNILKYERMHYYRFSEKVARVNGDFCRQLLQQNSPYLLNDHQSKYWDWSEKIIGNNENYSSLQ